MPRGPYAKNFPCLICGAPCGRRNSRCPEHAAAHRASRNKGYQRGYHEQHRPAPTPIPQPDPDLPPYGQIITDETRIQCHVCGRWYGALATHIRSHGLDTARYKETYGLARTSSLLGPAAAEKQRRAALSRNQGEFGRHVITELGPGTRPKGLANRRQSKIAISDGHRRHDTP